MRLAILIVFLIGPPLTIIAIAEEEGAPNLLPWPTGPFAIGHQSLWLEDRSRLEPLSLEHRHREVVVDVWYPAATKGQPTAYIDLASFEAALGPTGMQDLFGNAYTAIKEGRL